MISYPKIETLYDRDPKTFKVIPEKLRMPEFEIINRWYITEKIDGTNVRVMWNAAEKKLIFGGRTDNAQMPTFLLSYLQETFKPEMFEGFDGDIILFGEGYGEKIQKGGGNYRKGVSFRLFDVLIGRWWLEPSSVIDIALTKFHIETVPFLGIISNFPQTKEDLNHISGGYSLTSRQENERMDVLPEGVVARSLPLLFNRKGERVMWKLKFKDFA
jgi:hypothetical protein